MSVTEASITSRVVAKNTVNGAVLILNQGYTITIKPFPSRTGQIADISQNVSRRFPDAAPTGDYNVVDELIEAKVKVAFIWAPVTDYFLNRCLLAWGSMSNLFLGPKGSACIILCTGENTKACSARAGIRLVDMAVATTAVNVRMILKNRAIGRH